MNDDLNFDSDSKRSAKQGRRAAQSRQSKATSELDNPSPGPPQRKPSPNQNVPDEDDGPPKPSRVSGWGEDAPKRRGRNLGEGFEPYEDSGHKFNERLRPHSPDKSDESDNDIPVIPDLEEQQEEDITQSIAYAPNVAVNRVATYRELDNDLLKQAAFLTLDNDIDLKLLTKSLSTEADLVEDDKPWDWDRLFTEVTSELLTQWEKTEESEPQENQPVPQNA